MGFCKLYVEVWTLLGSNVEIRKKGGRLIPRKRREKVKIVKYRKESPIVSLCPLYFRAVITGISVGD